MAGNEDLVNALSGGGLLSSIAHPTVVNPLAAYGQANQVAAGIWANRRNQADQAAGQAFQQSVNPDGTPNQAALNRNLVAAGPTAALAAQDSAQKGQTLDTSTFVTHMARLTSLGNAAMALYAQHPEGVPQAAVHAEIDTQAAKLGLSPTDVAQAKAQFGPDAAANAATILRNHATNLNAQQALLAAKPSAGTVDAGGTVQGVQTPPQLSTQPPGAIAQVGAPVVKTMDPNAAGGKVEWEDQNGVKQQGTSAEWAIAHGMGHTISMPRPIAPGATATPATGDGGPTAPGAPSPTNQPRLAPVAAPGLTHTSGPTPGLVEAQKGAATATGAASSASYQETADAGARAPMQRAQLQNMAGDATLFTTGPGQDRIKYAQAAIQRFAPAIAQTFGVDPKSLAANEDFDKIANQLSDAQGAKSDARLYVNQGSNPSSHNTPAGLQLIVHKLVGNTDYAAAKAQLAADYQRIQDPTGAQSRQFEVQVGQQLNPRVFQFNRLSPAEQADYLKEQGAGKDAFKRDYLRIKAMGVLPNG